MCQQDKKLPLHAQNSGQITQRNSNISVSLDIGSFVRTLRSSWVDWVEVLGTYFFVTRLRANLKSSSEKDEQATNVRTIYR